MPIPVVALNVNTNWPKTLKADLVGGKHSEFQ